MRHPLRFSLLVLAIVAAGLVGCGGAEGMRRVQDARWQKVPPDGRGEVDRKHEPALTRAIAAEKSAAEAVTAAQRAIDDHLAERRANAAAPAPTPAEWVEADPAHGKAVAEARATVDTRKEAWLRADLRRRELIHRAAELRIDVEETAYELAKAQSVTDYSAPDQALDVPAYRGQSAKAQEAWYDTRQEVDAAQRETDRLMRELTEAKQKYAELKSEVPPPPVVEEPADGSADKGATATGAKPPPPSKAPASAPVKGPKKSAVIQK